MSFILLGTQNVYQPDNRVGSSETRRVLADYDVVSWAAWGPQTLTLNLQFGLFFSFLVIPDKDQGQTTQMSAGGSCNFYMY